MIIPIGEWVVQAACAEAATWGRPLRVAVNVSPIQFAQTDVAAMIERAISDTGLEPCRLEIEITEASVTEDPVNLLQALRRLKSLGVKLAMDDFGTGYSSLMSLKTFPFNKIKIDRSFISQVESKPADAAIVDATLALAGSLGIPVLAEGVETEANLAFLKARDCDEVQGYLFGKPAPAKDIAAIVKRIDAPLAAPALRRAS